MYTLNKIVGYLISPVGFSMAMVVVAAVARLLKRRRIVGWAVTLALANFWLWSTPWMSKWMGMALEAEFLVDGCVPAVESLPSADAIVLHGGSMGLATNISPYAEMLTSADRVWQAARLWREQVRRRNEKGESADIKIVVTGGSVKLTTAGLLQDFGVPTNAVVFAEEPRNTEEEAKEVAGFRFQVSGFRFRVSGFRFQGSGDKGQGSGDKGQVVGTGPETCSLKPETIRPKVLVVTSAWHMRRTMLMYEKYAPGVEAIPAPCDFENTLKVEKTCGWASLLPDPEMFMRNSIAFHEWLGYWGYKWLR